MSNIFKISKDLNRSPIFSNYITTDSSCYNNECIELNYGEKWENLLKNIQIMVTDYKIKYYDSPEGILLPPEKYLYVKHYGDFIKLNPNSSYKYGGVLSGHLELFGLKVHCTLSDTISLIPKDEHITMFL